MLVISFELFLEDLKLKLLKTNTFGMEEHYPLYDENAVDMLHNDCKQREQWLELFSKKIKK